MKKESGRPSVTFIIFLVLGIILFLWLVIKLTSQPMKPPLSLLEPFGAADFSPPVGIA